MISVPERPAAAMSLRRPATALHRLRCAPRGTAALEFALFAPLLLIMLVYVVELGGGVFEAMLN